MRRSSARCLSRKSCKRQMTPPRSRSQATEGRFDGASNFNGPAWPGPPRANRAKCSLGSAASGSAFDAEISPPPSAAAASDFSCAVTHRCASQIRSPLQSVSLLQPASEPFKRLQAGVPTHIAATPTATKPLLGRHERRVLSGAFDRLSFDIIDPRW